MTPDDLVQVLGVALAGAVGLAVGCCLWVRRAARELDALQSSYDLLFEEREIPESCDRCRVALARHLASRRASRALRGVPEASP